MNEFLSEIGGWIATNPVHAAGLAAGGWVAWKALKVIRAIGRGVASVCNWIAGGVIRWVSYRGELRRIRRDGKRMNALAEMELGKKLYLGRKAESEASSGWHADWWKWETARRTGRDGYPEA